MKEPGRWEFSVSFQKSFKVSVFYLSVQFIHSVVSDSLRPYGLPHARPPCPSPIPRVHPDPCPLSWWCHLAISSSVVPFSSCRQTFPASESFSRSWLFPSGDQSICSFSISPSNEYAGLISLRIVWFDPLTVPELSRVFSNTTVQKHQLFGAQPSLWFKFHIPT